MKVTLLEGITACEFHYKIVMEFIITIIFKRFSVLGLQLSLAWSNINY